MRQPFNNRRLSHSRLSDQDRIVLGLPGQDPDHAADFHIASDHRIQFPLAGHLDQIGSVFLKRLIGAFGIGAGDTLIAPESP